MSVVTKTNALSDFELKSAALVLVAVVLKTTDLAQLAQAMAQRFADAPALFEQDPVAIDLSPVRDDATPIDFAALIALLRQHRMVPVAVKGGSPVQMEAALAAGLGDAPDAAPRSAPRAEPPRLDDALPEVVLTEVVREVPTPARAALIVDKPLRSGQQVYARGTDLVVLAVVSHGAEVIADGSIHVYAPLRGRAIAGARGDAAARIYTTCMEPQLLCVAGTYRTTETALPDNVAGKPAQVRLDGDRLVVEPLEF